MKRYLLPLSVLMIPFLIAAACGGYPRIEEAPDRMAEEQTAEIEELAGLPSITRDTVLKFKDDCFILVPDESEVLIVTGVDCP